MFIKTFSYRFAEEILQNSKHIEAYDELLLICTNCPLSVFRGKSKSQPKLDVIQQFMNRYFQHAFSKLGWEIEPLATPDSNEDLLRADFRKSFHKEAEYGPITAQIEVEFGNVASSYRNFFKFQLSFSHGLTDVCVLIVPSQHLCTRIDSGVSNFEKVVREIPSAKLSITVPILVIGLFDVDENGVFVEEFDLKKECGDIDIAKGSSKEFAEKQGAVVEAYMERINLFSS